MSAAFAAFVFGVSLAISIGPIALLILTLAASEGLSIGVRAGLGAAAADFCYALLAFAGGAALARRAVSLSHLLAAPAALLLLALGLYLCLRSFRAREGAQSVVPQALKRRPFLGVLGLTLANPLTVLLFAGFAPQLPLAGSGVLAFRYAALVAAGSGIVQVGLALGGDRLRRRLRSVEHRRRLGALSGALIALFGVAGLVRASFG